MKMAAICKSYGVLPRAGGLLDQDSLFVDVLEAFDAAVAERTRIEQNKRKK
jgi:hypothetical protein